MSIEGREHYLESLDSILGILAQIIQTARSGVNQDLRIPDATSRGQRPLTPTTYRVNA